ncbi:MAG: PilX N-terminal domain-containing pilus assembly protein [Pseudomonas oryzihabitans]|uniref:PilX N-terminal domain-containing pilus assembly protein n=1 Tax=Pseudomonas oryzihabitans TaxID=47885 RepID=UPI00290EB0BF|nr:PilX N-terminal domain-containing pilus assembly protein [Pseudomonas oryzihabitans]MDU4058472.1 PilX N-terminal domain-containing pilus assembly protein [Pseudomonas oryzihabitans]
MTASRRVAGQRQCGASLLIALILLLLLTLLALTSLRGVTLESRVMGNIKQQRNLQSAAETALRAGEGALGRAVAAPDLASSCTTTFCVPYQLRNNAYLNAAGTALGSQTIGTRSVPLGYMTPLFRNGDPSATLDGYSILSNASATETPNARWYLVDLGPLDNGSENNCALTGCGTRYYEVNSCAGVGCASAQPGQRITLRSVMTKSF